MGGIGAILGGAVLGLGMSSSSKVKFDLPAAVPGAMIADAPETPEDPNAVGDGPTTDNALMEAEREKERRKAFLRLQQSQEVFTSGLGAAGMADTSKKQLLGG